MGSSKNSKWEVWRNKKGIIECPGDACPKNCDDTCPIYLNTMAAGLMAVGSGEKAIPLYEKALQIAPDFYDAWNNIGGLYGEQGNYQKAYNCYKKAHELYPNRPNPVYGLLLSSRDLGKDEECIKWCMEYKKLSVDGREKPVLQEVKSRIVPKTEPKEEPRQPEPQKLEMSNVKIIKSSIDSEWLLAKRDKTFFFIDITRDEPKAVKTPGGGELTTVYYELAERILHDLSAYGLDCMQAKSVLPWHYTIIDSFSKMSREQVVSVLEDSFLARPDWTFEASEENEQWEKLFGNRRIRNKAIKRWLDRCSYMQLTAACCIGNAYHSINVSYVIAKLMEEYSGKELTDKLYKLMELIKNNSSYDPEYEDFDTFVLYYGIQLKQNGNIIVKDEEIDDEDEDEELDDEEETEDDFWDDSDEEYKEPEDVAGLSVEEKYGNAWLGIIGENHAEGLKLMHKLSRDGFSEAMVAEAMFMDDMIEKKATVKKAADLGNAEGMWQYAVMLPHSYVPDLRNEEDKLYIDCCTEAAKKGSADAMNELGNIYHRRKEFLASAYWYAMAYHYEFKDGSLSLQGIANEWKRAGKPLQYTKTSGLSQSQAKAATACLELWADEEITVPIDEMIRFTLEGEALAGFTAAEAFENTDNDLMAYKMFNSLAFDNEPHALRCYADMLMAGKGVSKDEASAHKFYKMAAERGERAAMFVMGEFTKTDNKNMAAYWYGMSHARGYEYALIRLKQLAEEK